MALEARHLEVLVAVDDAGSIGAAARRLGCDQPQLTRRLRRIEALAGVTVFHRTPTGTVPTAQGRDLLARAREALAALDAVTTRPGPAELRLLVDGLVPTLVPLHLARTRPDLRVTVTAMAAGPAARALRDGTADAFAGYRVQHAEWEPVEGVAERDVVEDPTVVFLPDAHPLAGRAEIDLADLADADWIAGSTEEARRSLRRECRLVGGFDPRLSFRVLESESIRHLLGHGMAVVLGSSVAPRRPGFVARPYRGATPSRWVLRYAPDRVPRDLADEVVEVYRREFHRLRDEAARHDAGPPEGRVS